MWSQDWRRIAAAALLLGSGVFNVTETPHRSPGLGIHHVREGQHHTAWDLAVLALFALVAAAGLWLLHAEREPVAP
jgi:uncharacterized membrane protein